MGVKRLGSMRAENNRIQEALKIQLESREKITKGAKAKEDFNVGSKDFRTPMQMLFIDITQELFEAPLPIIQEVTSLIEQAHLDHISRQHAKIH